MAAEIKSFLFGKNEVLLLALSNNTNRNIPIHGEYDDDELTLIHDINRRHIMTVFEEDLNTDGCLPSKCMGVEAPSVNISPRYLTHCFVNIMELLFKTDENATLFERNKDMVVLPTSNDNLEKIMMTMTSSQKPLSMEMEGEAVGGDNVNFTLFLQLLIEKMFTMQKQLKGMVSKNTSKINTKMSVMGGINREMLKTANEETDILSTGLQECSDVIHATIRKNAQLITKTVLDPNNASMVAMKKVVQICSEQQQQQPLYANLNISFTLMYECIGEVFNVLLINIIPRNSMMEAMQGSFYNAAVLSELKLQDRFPNLLCIPVLYRFIHSCFKDEESACGDDTYEQYLEQNYRGVLTQIEKLQRGHSNQDEILCTIALKSNIRDKKYNEALYWVLNQKRSCTFEYYMILMTVLYISARCSNVNAISKRSNALVFIAPIYSIMRLFYQYVSNLGIESSLCSSTMENFSTMYQGELKTNLEIVAKSMV